jgi:hypothetical protein
MIEYITYHKILDYFENYQQSTVGLNSFGDGDLVYFATTNSGTTIYPLMFVTPQLITYDENITTYQFSVIFGDIVNTDMSNQQDVITDMSIQAKRFISQFKRGTFIDEMDIQLPVVGTPFIERFNDHIGGVSLDCSVTIFEDLNACDYYEPEPSPTQTPSPSPTQTPYPLCPQSIVGTRNRPFSTMLPGTNDYDRITTFNSGYLTTVSYGSATFVSGAAPNGLDYVGYGKSSGSTYYQYMRVYNEGVDAGWLWSTSNGDYLANGGSPISTGPISSITDPTLTGSTISDGYAFPIPGFVRNSILGNLYYLAYPSSCPTPTPTNTSTPTPTPSLAPSASVEYITNDSNTTNLSAYTFTNISYGGSGYIIVGLYYSRVSPSAVVNMTLDGISATEIQKINNGSLVSSLWGVQMTGGSSANLVITITSGAFSCDVGIWRTQNLLSTTPIDSFTTKTSVDNVSGTLTGLTTDAVIISHTINDNDSGFTWTNITGNYDVIVEGVGVGGASRQSPSGSLTITQTSITPNNSGGNMLNTIALR